MKKVLFSIVLVFCTLLSAYAVPSGSYVDDRGRKEVDVTIHNEIYVYDRDGYVTTYKVVEEHNDGTFVMKVIAIKGQRCEGPELHRNAYFWEDGKLYLNLQPLEMYGSFHRVE